MFNSRSAASVTVIAVIVFVFQTPLHAQRASVEAMHGMVTSAHELASQVGVEILKKGGNAVDAAVATGLALAVVYPTAGNLGGGGFMLIHLAEKGEGQPARNLVIDYRESAPLAATAEMYVGQNGEVLKGAGSSTVGWRASGVPGTVAGFALALEKYGSRKLSWADVCEPARRLAAEGHIVTQGGAVSLRNSARLLEQFEDSKRIYLNNGILWKKDDLWLQPELAATFERLQKAGPREFYTGETARRIVDAMTANGGIISLADLANYQPVERVPLTGSYRGYEIVTMPPPSSGGIAVLQMLAMIEPFDVAAMGHSSAAKYHLFAEVMRRAFRDRAEHLGDPGYVDVPVSGMLDPAYIIGLMKNFDPGKATRSEDLEPGRPAGTGVPPSRGRANDEVQGKAGAEAIFKAESTETTHFSVVDADGNAVANTYTLNGNFGSGVTIPGTGVLMNNEMDDFTAKVGVKNMFGLLQGTANAIAPGKRPLSSMTPTFVFKDKKLVLVTGSPGGPTIINTVLQVISNVVDFRMPVMRAVEAPRIHHQWMPDELTFESYGISADTEALLTGKGHKVKERKSYEGSYQGDGETIMIDPKSGLRFGAADPRKPDSRALGY